jgi:translation initiation factor eIF-2B subunit delta
MSQQDTTKSTEGDGNEKPVNASKKQLRSPPPNIEPKPKLSKAERRELQEKQRSEKAARNNPLKGGVGFKETGVTSTKQSTPRPPTDVTPEPTTLASPPTGNVSSSSSANQNVVSLVSYLPPFRNPLERFQLGASIKAVGGDENLHPCVIQTGYLYAIGQIRGGNSRCRAMLNCYLRLLRDFSPPKSVISSRTHQHSDDLRHAIEHIVLKPAFQYWTEHCRPHSVSMGNAFTFLKTATSSLNRDMSWNDMSETLVETILAYQRERIEYADLAIAEIACQKMLFSSKSREEVFLTYGNSEAVRAVLKQASIGPLSSDDSKLDPELVSNGRRFRVVVVDSRPLLEGRDMLSFLRKLNIKCTYCLLSAVTYVLKDVTKVLLGAASLSSDGSVFGRVGTAAVAMAAHHENIPVLICSETYKISNRVFSESITNNEVGNPIDILCTSDEEKTFPSKPNEEVQIVNLLYDLTPADFVSGIITELGIVPPTSIAVLLREMNPQ